jgi:hypothetical protein
VKKSDEGVVQPVPVVPQMSLKERMAAKAAKATPTVSAAKKTKDRANIRLEGADAKALDDFCAYDNIATLAESHMEVNKNLVNPVMRKKFLEMWAEKGFKPESSNFVTEKSSCMFVGGAARTSSFRIDPNLDGTPKTTEQYLKDNGVPGDIVKELLEKEITDREIVAVTSPDDLEAAGHTKLADKIREMLLENLTDEESKLVLKNQREVKIKDKFLERVAGYCKAMTPEETFKRLEKVLTVTRALVPAIRNKQTEDKAEALKTINDGKKLEDKTPPQVLFTNDNLYRMEATGEGLTIFRMDGSRADKIGFKKCTDTGHAVNSARVFQKDRVKLETFLKESAE